jgi:hypothetical protein
MRFARFADRFLSQRVSARWLGQKGVRLHAVQYLRYRDRDMVSYSSPAFAHIEMATPSAVLLATQRLNGQELRGKKVLVRSERMFSASKVLIDGDRHFMLSVYPSIGATGRMSGGTLAAQTRLWTAGPSQTSLVRQHDGAEAGVLHRVYFSCEGSRRPLPRFSL